MNNNIAEQIDTFGYFGCSVSYQSKWDIAVKIKILQLKEIINRI